MVALQTRSGADQGRERRTRELENEVRDLARYKAAAISMAERMEAYENILNLMGEPEKLPVGGKVIWVTPKGAQDKRTAGIGVQFSDQDQGNTQKKIENYLAGALGGDKPTHTM